MRTKSASCAGAIGLILSILILDLLLSLFLHYYSLVERMAQKIGERIAVRFLLGVVLGVILGYAIRRGVLFSDASAATPTLVSETGDPVSAKPEKPAKGLVLSLCAVITISAFIVP